MDALHRQTDTWLANGLAGGLRPGLNDRIAWFRGLKAICEIAFFVALSPHRHAAVLVEAVDACLLDLWAGGRLLALARHNLQHANLFLPLLLSCQMRLQLDERCKADIRKVAGVSLAHTKERIPFRQIDLLHSAWKLTGSKRLPARMARAARHGCLRGSAHIATIEPADDYAITHTVFYLTDFGRRSWPAGLAVARDVDAILWSLSRRPANRDNFDIRGELLLARIYLGAGGPQLEEDAAALWRARSPEATWPGPADLSAKLEAEQAPRSLWPFLLHYHTTLVCREALAALEPDAADPPPAARKAVVPAPARRPWPRPGMPGLQGVANAFLKLKAGRDAALPGGALRDPAAILHAVEWHLLRRALLGGRPARPCADLRSLAATDETVAWSDRRLARIVLSAGLAMSGTAFLQRHRRQIDDFAAWMSGKGAFDLSLDEACICALLHANGDGAIATGGLARIIDRYVAEADLLAALQVSTLACLHDIEPDLARKVQSLLRSYRARSMPIGYLMEDGGEAAMLAAQIRISVLKFECVTSRRRRPTEGLRTSKGAEACGAPAR